MLDSVPGKVVGQFRGVGVGKAFSKEMGKHVIQRVPPTEKNGRWQTSVVGVAVLPMPPQQTQKLLPEYDLDIVAFKRSSGPGGQAVNKTSNAIRITHKPTKVQVVICTERSQQQNKAIALRIISAKVNEHKNSATQSAYDQGRKTQLGGGGRGDKIRTYNFIKKRAVDHRSGKKTNAVEQVIERGRFDLLI
jgi:peptide chain release factor 1